MDEEIDPITEMMSNESLSASVSTAPLTEKEKARRLKRMVKENTKKAAKELKDNLGSLSYYGNFTGTQGGISRFTDLLEQMRAATPQTRLLALRLCPTDMARALSTLDTLKKPNAGDIYPKLADVLEMERLVEPGVAEILKIPKPSSVRLFTRLNEERQIKFLPAMEEGLKESVPQDLKGIIRLHAFFAAKQHMLTALYSWNFPARSGDNEAVIAPLAKAVAVKILQATGPITLTDLTEACHSAMPSDALLVALAREGNMALPQTITGTEEERKLVSFVKEWLDAKNNPLAQPMIELMKRTQCPDEMEIMPYTFDSDVVEKLPDADRMQISANKWGNDWFVPKYPLNEFLEHLLAIAPTISTTKTIPEKDNKEGVNEFFIKRIKAALCDNSTNMVQPQTELIRTVQFLRVVFGKNETEEIVENATNVNIVEILEDIPDKPNTDELRKALKAVDISGAQAREEFVRKFLE